VQILSSTIDDFRNFFKPEKEKERVKLTLPIIRALNIVEESMKSKNITIVTEFNVDKKVTIYQNEMMQVFLNILKNSEDSLVENMSRNAQIKIETKEVEKYYLISITDNGMGIPNDIVANIFDPYFSTKDKKNGTGLGLYMSKIIVQEHNSGILKVFNIEGGVCVEVYLEKEENV
jgi:C4-dicarboxylate-specific signal transduction histidine kinase